jgi:hypothetical protein
MGDLSCVMPAVHPYMPGAVGMSHGANYYVENPDLACVGSAKWQVAMLYLLLKDDAARAKEIIAGFKPRFPSIPDYLAYMDSLILDRDAVRYDEEGNVLLNLGPAEKNV